MLFLALKKTQLVNITPYQFPTTQLKISFVARFLIALTNCPQFPPIPDHYLEKSELPICTTKEFLEKNN